MSWKFYKVPHTLAARRDLCWTDKAVLAALADHQGTNGRSWPGLRCLGRELGMSKDTAGSAIQRLLKAGEIRCESNDGGDWRRGRRRFYRLVESVGDFGRSEASEKPDGVSGKPGRQVSENPDEVSGGLGPNQTNNQTKGTRPTNPAAVVEDFAEAYRGYFARAYVADDRDREAVRSWRKACPDTPSGEVVDVAGWLWGRREFCPQAAYSLRGLLSKWPELAAQAVNLAKAAGEAPPGPKCRECGLGLTHKDSMRLGACRICRKKLRDEAAGKGAV